MASVICVDNLSKEYKVIRKEVGFRGSLKSLIKKEFDKKMAVNNISFEVSQGEFIGFIGPNGAGKTTTIKMLSGIINPTVGKVNVLGYKPSELKNDFKKSIAVTMGQKNQLWWDIPAKDSFELLKVIYDIPTHKYNVWLDELVDVLDVKHLLLNPIRNLSLGERMKMELIGSILHSPKVLFLDEPTIGLDITSRKKIREFLKYMNEEKKITVLLTSHYMDDIDYLCNRVIAINKGVIRYDGNKNDIKKEMTEAKIVSATSYDRNALEVIKQYGEVIAFDENEIKLKIEQKNMNDLGGVLFKNEGYYNISIEDVSLDDTFENLFGRELQC